MDNKIILTDNGKLLLSFFQNNDLGIDWTAEELQMITDISWIRPAIDSLIRNGLIEENSEATYKDFLTREGKLTIKAYKTYHLTDMGRSFII